MSIGKQFPLGLFNLVECKKPLVGWLLFSELYLTGCSWDNNVVNHSK
jgi:hypothetical protein